MSANASSSDIVCEQCGEPLAPLGVGAGCLHCLLQTGIAAASPDKLLKNERRIYQHYEILRREDGSLWELGRNATSVTYKARDMNLDMVVALKVLNPELSRQPEARARFLRQAQAMAQIRHPNVANVLQFGMLRDRRASSADSGGECFYAMEFVEGESLLERVIRAGLVSPQVALEIVKQVAQVFHTAEKYRLTHSEVGLSKILIVEDESASIKTAKSSGVWVKIVDLETNFDTLPSEESNRLTNRRTTVTSDLNDAQSVAKILWYLLFGQPFSQHYSLQQIRICADTLAAPIGTLLEMLIGMKSEYRCGSGFILVEEIQRCLEGIISQRNSRSTNRKKLPIAVGVAAILVFAVISSAIWPKTPDRSIAVLPFRNVGQRTADGLFAEGMQDDIVSRLVKIRDLKVIGHLGVAQVLAKGSSDLVAVGRRLRVTHLLNGELRHEGDRILLEVHLINVRNGQEIWSEQYDRRLRETITLQGELASDIVSALNSKLSMHERHEVRLSSTYNPDAYTLYLRGRQLENSLLIQITNYEAAKALYNQAVALDPGFALAHARLACVLGVLYRFGRPTEELRSQAYFEVREALRLHPNLGEGHFARGLNSYRIERDFDRALAELEIARQLLPNDTDPDAFISLIRRRQGRWQEAQRGLQRVRQLNPLDRKYAEELHATSCLLRDWASAAHHADDAVEMTPSVIPLQIERALVDLWQNGSLDRLQKISVASKACPEAEGDYTWIRWDVAMLGRDFSAAKAAIDDCRREVIPTILGAPLPKSYLMGCVLLANGYELQALEMFENSRPSMEGEALAVPRDAMRHARLGLLYAYMGRKADALREGERAVEITPISEDAVEGHQWLCNLALIHARVGDADKATKMIESLLREPGCVSPLNEACLTLWDLRLRWQWDPLRKDPRFQKILAGPEPSTIYQ